MNFVKKVSMTIASLGLALHPLAFAAGAIAVGDADRKAQDSSTEKYFVATGHRSSESAQAAAIKECEAKGLHFCHVASWFDQCGAYAKSATTSGTGTGPTQQEAERIALISCGKDCEVVVVQCEADTKT